MRRQGLKQIEERIVGGDGVRLSAVLSKESGDKRVELTKGDNSAARRTLDEVYSSRRAREREQHRRFTAGTATEVKPGRDKIGPRGGVSGRDKVKYGRVKVVAGGGFAFSGHGVT